MDNGTKWAYLNGHVGYGDWHHQIIDQLASRAGIPDWDARALSNYALVNAIPAVEKHDIAWGHLHHNIPVFWNTNVDRSAVNRAVAQGISAADLATRDNGGRAIGGDSLDSADYNQNGGNVAVAHTVESLFGGTPSGLRLEHYGPDDVQNLAGLGARTVNYEGQEQYWHGGGKGGHVINAVDEDGIPVAALHYNHFPERLNLHGEMRPEQLYVSEMHVPESLRNTQLAYEMGRKMIENHPGVPIASVLAEKRLAPLIDRYNRNLGFETQQIDSGDTMKALAPFPKGIPNAVAKTAANGGTALRYIAQGLGATINPTGGIDGIPQLVLPDGNKVDIRLQAMNEPYGGGGKTLFLVYVTVEGKNQGVGTQIMNLLKAYSDQTGMMFRVYMPADAAHPFYNKFDWLNHPSHYDYNYVPGGKMASVFANLAPWYLADGHVIVGNFGQTAEEIGWEEGMVRGTVDIQGQLTCHAKRIGLDDGDNRQYIRSRVEARYANIGAHWVAPSDTGWWVEGTSAPRSEWCSGTWKMPTEKNPRNGMDLCPVCGAGVFTAGPNTRLPGAVTPHRPQRPVQEPQPDRV